MAAHGDGVAADRGTGLYGRGIVRRYGFGCRFEYQRPQYAEIESLLLQQLARDGVKVVGKVTCEDCRCVESATSGAVGFADTVGERLREVPDGAAGPVGGVFDEEGDGAEIDAASRRKGLQRIAYGPVGGAPQRIDAEPSGGMATVAPGGVRSRAETSSTAESLTAIR